MSASASIYSAVGILTQKIDFRLFSENDFECRILLLPEPSGGYSAHAINLPGVVSQGESDEEAVANLQEAFAGAIQAYQEAGEKIPWTTTETQEKPQDAKERWIVVNV